ncbi:sulfurtransferase [Paraclostridium ghonii]|uniref:Thiosulfate/3-mercaptopyruvate sulfurtransferase n=1 Tax=Paraclostridium ghonii TaxID=29358 RepID=A0ABU0N3I4_9FIRM|nr:sulfurtransferase [Paeniclostridium ghonii]MDQ0557725.1 thiosulfate/3-mercaptopyruvate sulfurtransferase [Paeniclostridium ghonii]
MKNFVDCSFITNFKDPSSLFLIDCRFDLFDESLGYESYKESHIPNAFYLDINQDLCGESKIHGGARPLPDKNILHKKLSSFGISENSTIVVYDEKLYSSPRAFVQLKYMGYKNVYILNGGFKSWKEINLPITSILPSLSPASSFELMSNKDMICDVSYVKKAIANDNIVLVDSRDNNRYTGEIEPLYKNPGHIPGAINIPWHKSINSNGFIKNLDIVDKNFINFKNKEIITYCGSCIEACINYALLDELSYNVKAYIGSMSDWISYYENDVESSF